MKVLLTTINHFQDAPGGMPRVVLDESRELVRRGFEVFVLGTAVGESPAHEVCEGVHLLRYTPKPARAWSPGRKKAHQVAATRVLASHLPQVDAIHGHAPLSHIAALDFYRGLPTSSYTVHSPVKLEMEISWNGSGWARRLTAPLGFQVLNLIERDILRRTGVVTALSQFTVKCLRQIHGSTLADRVRVIPGWVDTARFRPAAKRTVLKRELGWREDAPVLFTLRRMERRMGLDSLLESAALVREEGLPFQLMIGGTGSMRPELESAVRSLKLEHIVTFLGRVPDSALPSYYAACDAFVLPTKSLECFGIIALEALSSGAPVLATPVGAIPEVVSGIGPGWFAKSTSARDIADLLIRYLRGELTIPTPDALHNYVDNHYREERGIDRLLTAAFSSVQSQQ